MQQVMAKVIETIVSLLETFAGSGNNLAAAGLGAGGLGLSADILRRMLVSPETDRAMREIMPEGRERQLGLGTKFSGNTMYQPTESDFRGWRNEINLKMDKHLKEMGLDKEAAALFKRRTGNLAYQIDRVCRRYADPIERNQKVSALIDRELNVAVRTAQRQQEMRSQGWTDVLYEKVTLQEKEQRMGRITGGMKDMPAFFNGLTSSQGIPVWMPDTAIQRLEGTALEMERIHRETQEAVEKATRQANDKLSLHSIDEGIKKGLLTADDLVRKGTELYAGGDNFLLARMGLVNKYEEYKSSLLLDNPTRADRIMEQMKQGAMEYIREVQGTGSQVVGHELTMTQKVDTPHMSMGFGFKF